MEKLKPCPFCGGKAELYESEAYNLKTEEKEEQIRFFVICEECTALVCGLSKKVASERWNMRVSDGNSIMDNRYMRSGKGGAEHGADHDD